MTDVRVLADAVELAAARVPFALATVVWRRGPSSGHVGAKALITGDGVVHGWLGGACAQPTVVRAAIDAMHDGQPRLLFLGQPDELDRRAEEGMVTVPMACESEGAIEVYLEPVVPRPQLVPIGRSPAVFALASLGVALGWDVAVIDDGGRTADHPHPSLVRTALDLSGLDIGGASAIVVATQGHYDDLALESALATDAGYIGLVASRKRADSTIDLMRRRGVPGDQLMRIVAPAGIDLGPIENHEIAVSILADLVARRASGRLTSTTPSVTAPVTVVDPVCGMSVAVHDAKHVLELNGELHYFCAAGCKAAFAADPTRYLAA